MGKGYISLFFDDSTTSLPNEELEKSKEQIFTNYKNAMRRPGSEEEKQDLRDFVDNQILQGVNEALQRGNAQGESQKDDPIKY